jgi:hypothetical protein
MMPPQLVDSTASFVPYESSAVQHSPLNTNVSPAMIVTRTAAEDSVLIIPPLSR